MAREIIEASPKKPGKHAALALTGFVMVNLGIIPTEKDRH
jgi:hypothetical protein